MPSRKKIMIMAGGTGGHVFPALATANELIARGVSVEWLGTESGMERDIVCNAGITYHSISIKGLRGNGALSWIMAPFKIFSALVQALACMLKVKPDAVLGMGGYVSGPGGIAAWLMKIPLLVHEQNSIAGMTNKILSRISRKVMVAFPGTQVGGPRENVVTGNPIRKEILDVANKQLSSAQELESSGIKILIVGGSLGAVAINKLIPPLAKKLTGCYQLWHQTGKKNYDSVVSQYQELGINIESDKVGSEKGKKIKVEAFIENMAQAYSWADMIICRAGALTVSEISAVGIASVLIPYPYAVDDHQTLNGLFLEKNGAAIIIQERDLVLNEFVNIVESIMTDVTRLNAMRENARRVARPDATTAVADICMEASYA